VKLVASEWYITYEPRHDSSDRLGDARCYLKWTLRDLAQSLKRAHESVLITCGDDMPGNAAFEARKVYPKPTCDVYDERYDYPHGDGSN
jgi:hypothetical protein